jgi:hypothetical protein
MIVTTTPHCAAPGSHDSLGDQLLAELIHAIEHGCDQEDYTAARAAGSNHELAIALADNGALALKSYSSALHCGATDTQFREALDTDVDPFAYACAIGAGVSHEELISRATALKESCAESLHVDEWKMYLTAYIKVRRTGATDTECADIPVKRWFTYAELRAIGTSHAQVCSLRKLGVTLPTYLDMREGGYMHEGAIDALTDR